MQIMPKLVALPKIWINILYMSNILSIIFCRFKPKTIWGTRKKCPKGEHAIEMKLNNNNKLKYAFLLDPSLHPNKLQMPCCKGTPPDKIQDKKKPKLYY